MRIEDWRDLVVEATKKISDKNYQKLSWFGKGDVISSPEELYCGLLDDLIFDDYLAQDSALSDEQRAMATTLKTQLEEYFSLVGDLPDPYHVIDDPRWERVRQSARAFVESLGIGSRPSALT